MLGQMISHDHYARMLARGRKETSRMLGFDAGTMRELYNRKPFQIEHHMANHPAFSLESLFTLCRRRPPQDILFRMGNIPGDEPLETSYDHYKKDLTLSDVLDHFEESQAYICINNPERDPEYQPIIEGLIGEIAAQTHGMDPWITWYSTYVFISTRHAVTPYHMDREMNFLLQLRGTKQVFLWDQDDDDIMSSEQKDLLLSRVGNRPRYLPSFEAKAMAYTLEPGVGVHHPFIAPHRVHTAGELSVSLALTFRTRQSDMWTDAYRFNARLRQFGLHPSPIGRNAWLDRAKCGFARAGQRVNRLLHGAEAEPT
ncbi:MULTISPECIES: cupin-like domain-containing protein [Dyella]|uniref:Transcription factor jumonji JmjC domain-containing protein n=2 Tax=Dyella TaxID=231454 RepID=A0A4R0YE02_9GAMM|nr:MULTISPECIES: cupin-like domain-containing protein [Dyella]TBR36185.1 transcription factor jumonji JmjC domain-containing protein [Dyella terrae]TCI06234.1 transcription factor jumonji JmjC domain-containing protein [Dyella soli]